MIGVGFPFYRKKAFPLFKPRGRRAEWKHRRRRGAGIVVKGLSRRVIVVQSPDPRVFEEAIFVVREDWMRARSAEEVVQEARRAAGEYLKQCALPERRSVRGRWGALFAAAVTLGIGAIWALCRLLFA